jgi:hypothetical protein
MAQGAGLRARSAGRRAKGAERRAILKNERVNG